MPDKENDVAITEQSRYNVHKHFEETMGQELAATLMEMLPGVGWADVARKRDLDVLERRIDGLEAKVDALRTHIDESLRHHLFTTVAITCTSVGLVGAAARFL